MQMPCAFEQCRTFEILFIWACNGNHINRVCLPYGSTAVYGSTNELAVKLLTT